MAPAWMSWAYFDIGFEVLVRGKDWEPSGSQGECRRCQPGPWRPEYWDGIRRRPPGIWIIHSYSNTRTLPQSLPAIRHLYWGLNQSFTQNLRFWRVRTDTGCAEKAEGREHAPLRLSNQQAISEQVEALNCTIPTCPQGVRSSAGVN